MITGQQLMAILKFNKISYQKFAEYLGYKSFTVTHSLTKLEFIPYVVQKKLSEILGLDLFKEENLKLILESIPERYFIRTKKIKKNDKIVIKNIFKI